ncbi:MAG: sigma-70 family RNA polymerase sigma factor [Mesorhizobium sp.]
MSSSPDRMDREALTVMLSGLRPRLHRYAARMTGSVIDGEDIVQEALVKALRALDDGLSVDKPEQWLFRIAHNAAHDHLRRRKRENAHISEADLEAVEDPTQASDSRIVAQAGLRTFMQLPVAQRGATILVDVLGLSLHETREATGATLAATKAALHRGRTRLRLLASQPLNQARPALSPHEELRLRLYVDRFNARDFDAVRALLAEDVRLDVVNQLNLRGKARVSTYFGNYDRLRNWRLSPGFVDSRPAILLHDPMMPEAGPRGFILLEWREGAVTAIRDFRHVPYCLTDAETRALDN